MDAEGLGRRAPAHAGVLAHRRRLDRADHHRLERSESRERLRGFSKRPRFRWCSIQAARAAQALTRADQV